MKGSFFKVEGYRESFELMVKGYDLGEFKSLRALRVSHLY
jgi:hypothetical protein